MSKKSNWQIAFIVLIFVCLAAQAGFAQTTAFTFQGKLTDLGSPPTAVYQMEFKLFAALTGGSQIGATMTNSSVSVTQGIFTVNLDFGVNAFPGADRFLEIAVRRNSGESFVILTPRQQIASSPYSIKAISAQQADLALDSNKLGGINASEYVTTSSVGNSFIRNSTTQQTADFNISGNGFVGGNLGIGTTNPLSKVMAQTLNFSYGFTQTNGTVTVGSYIDPTGGWLGTRSNHPLYFFTNGGLQQMTLATNGNFGIGTTNPNTRLTLNGGAGWTTAGWTASMNMQNASALGWEANASGQRFGIGQSGGGLYFFRTNSAFGNTANPANYDMIINDAGNVIQSRDKGGFVKAMVFVNGDGTIIRCYNGITGASSGTCGFIAGRGSLTSGEYFVDFGFQISDRFYSATVDSGCCVPVSVSTVIGFTPNTLRFFVYIGSGGVTDRPVMLIVY